MNDRELEGLLAHVNLTEKNDLPGTPGAVLEPGVPVD
jgi:hypothetical protein